MMIRMVLLRVTMLAAPLAYADDISGFWKHVEELIRIEMGLDEGRGTVVRHD